MEPDPDGPFQRVERTLVSVWCYITEAVGRFLRPQPAEATDNNPTSSDEPRVDGEPADGSQIDDGARGVEVGEEPSLSTVSLVSSSSPVVAWERCTADIDLNPKEEDHENKEELIEEQLGQTGNDFAGQLVAESVKVHQGSHEKTDIEKCDTCEESLAPENDGQLATGHGWVKEGVFEDMDPREIRSRDHQKVLETSADIEEEAEENSEESNEKTGDPNVNKSSAAMLGDANIGEDASQLSSGNQNFPDEKTKDVETQLRQLSEDENVQMSLFEEAATAEESEQVKSGQTTEDILTQSGTSSKDVQKTEPETTECTIREEDVQLTILQTAEEDVTVEEMSADLDYEMAEGKNLSAEHENPAEQTQQEETRQLVWKELSEDERVEEEKDNMSATHEESEDRKSSRGDEDVQREENVLAQSFTSSEDDQEQFNLKGNDSAEQLINKNKTEHQLGLEKKLHTSAETEVIENKEENTTNEANYEELEKRGDGDVGEESVSRKREEEVAKVVEVKEELEEESDDIQTDDREKHEEEFEEESEAEQFTTDGETGEQREGENTAANQQTEESEKEKSRRTNEEENISTQSVTSIEIDQRTEEEQFSQTGNDSGDQLIPEDMTTHQLGLEKTEIQNLHSCEEIERVENKGFQEERGEIQEDNRDEDFIVKQHIMKEEREEQKEGEAGPVMLGDANICEDAPQLKSENENSAERTEQVETQQLVCEELSGVVDDEESVSGEEAEQDKGSREVEDVRQEKNILNLSPTSSEGDQDTGEEQFNQTDSDRSFDETKEDWEEECREIQEDDAEETERDFEEKSEVPGNDEEEATVGSEHVQLKEGVTDGTESSEEEELLRLDDRWKVLGTLADIVEDDEEEAEEDSEEESKMQETTPTKEEEGSNEKTEGERDNKVSAAMQEDANLSEDASLLNFSDEKTKVETLLPVCRDAVTDINVQMTDFGDEDLNQTTDEELEEDKNRRTIEEEKIEFTFKEDDVTSMETATEKEMTVEEIISDVEERLSDKEICMKRDFTTAPVTVKAGGVSEQEINIGFSDIPLGVIEGQAGLSHELNTKACEETPEAVPEHNNEPESDQNTTQRFFEGGNSEEIQTIHLPEEVEVFKSTEAGGGEYLLIKEGSTEESKELQVGTLQFADDTEKPKSDNINLVLDHFSEEEKVELLDTSMKTEIKQSDKEFETKLEDEDETAELETNRLPQDVCEKRNAVAADEGVDSADETPEFPKSEEGKMAQISLGPELLQAFRLEDDREIKPKLFDESATELPQVRFDTKEQEFVDEDQPEHEVLDLNEIATLHLVGTASDLITGQSALSQCQITTDTETADESKTTLGEITNEPQQTEKYSKDSAEEHQDGIDEEILDLWIETAMSKDSGGIKEDQRKEEPGETSSEEKKEGVMEAISEETETSLITLDSGFLDQTFSETQIIKSGDSVVLADKKDNSEDICEVPASNSEFSLMEEMIETLQPYRIAEGASGEIGSCPDSGVSSPEPKHPNQEGGTAEKKQDETKPETDAASGDDEEADVTSLTEATESDISREIQISPLLEEESVLTEPPSGGEPQNEPEKRNFSLDAPEEKPSQDLSGSFPPPSRTELEEDWSEVDAAMLDFAVQKSRIAVKNPRVRPPTDPRSLIHKPSVDPTPSLPVAGKVPVGVPLGGLGIGIKLPGIGAGFPVLKKTQRPPSHEDKPETKSQESEEKREEEEKSDAAKKDEAPKRPKWMPPAQPGFGNPLMSELKTKLKKTPKE